MSEPSETTTPAADAFTLRALERLLEHGAGSMAQSLPLASFLEQLLSLVGLVLDPWQVDYLKALLSSDSALKTATVRPRICLSGLIHLEPQPGLKPQSLLSSEKLAGYSCSLVTLDFYPSDLDPWGFPLEQPPKDFASACAPSGSPPSSTPATSSPSNAADAGAKDG